VRGGQKIIVSIASKIGWRARRLRAMGAAEIGYRIGQQLTTRLEQLGLGLARPLAPKGDAGKPWIEPLPAQFHAPPYLLAADRILAGRFDIFAAEDLNLGFPPRWSVDPKTGKNVPLHFGKAIDYRDPELVGDVKYLWELNRHLQLVTLAQAWHLGRDDRYLDGCRRFIVSWIDDNPYPIGINWTSSLELALRLTNWAFAWHMLGGESSPLFEGEAGAYLRERWLGNVRQHCHFVRGYLSRHSSANNHLLAELMGLLVAAMVWPLWPESARWRATAASEFEGQALLQTAPDGVNREQAIYYQHEVMDMMLICGLLGRRNGTLFGAPFWARLEAMMEYVRAVLDRSGNVPMIGDSDDALMVRFSQEAAWNPYRSLLATGAVLFDRSDFAFAATRFDDKSRWLLGDAAATRFEALKTAPRAERRRAFPDGGYYVLGSSFDEPDEIIATFDCGPLGYLSIAAHGHADALALTLSARGRQLLVDCGTFAYHTETLWRNYFRSTAAHNTVRIDGIDQSTIGGNFLWLQKAQARCTALELDGPQPYVEGEHDGYTRLRDPVMHRRRVSYSPSRKRFEIVDSIDCKGEHAVELFWHFAETCDVQSNGSRIVATAGDIRLLMSFSEAPLALRFARGEDLPPLGWLSRRFDQKTPITTAVCAAKTRGTMRLTTIIELEFAPPTTRRPEEEEEEFHGGRQS
jgi:hypothetical protein